MLPFENPAHYRRRLKRDRLNREIVVAYLRQLGIDLTDARLWDAQGETLCLRQTLPPNR